jgi:hypothetical protein
MSDLICYLPNHGYANDTPVLVDIPPLTGIVYYVSDRTQNSFKLAVTSGGSYLVQYITSQPSGSIRRVDSGSSTTSITGLDHLEGQIVYLTSNGEIVGQYTVANGAITVAENIYAYQVGLPYSMKVKSMRIEVANAPMTTQKKIKRITELGIRYLKSIGGKIGQEINDVEHLQDLDCEFNTKSKDVAVLNKYGYDPDSYVVVKSDLPYPFTLISIMTTLDVTE